MTKADPGQAPILHSVQETARLLNVSKWQVYALINSRQLASIKIGRRRLIPSRAINELAEAAADGDSL